MSDFEVAAASSLVLARWATLPELPSTRVVAFAMNGRERELGGDNDNHAWARDARTLSIGLMALSLVWARVQNRSCDDVAEHSKGEEEPPLPWTLSEIAS